ncbi:MAG: beta-phosphoglucomutase, partial [Phycisphaerae bacterium]
GWKRLADEEGIFFDRTINERLRGVSRMESLAIILERSPRSYSETNKIALATRKNNYYRDLLSTDLSPANILPGVNEFLAACKARGIKIAIGSSSRNSPTILNQIGMSHTFDATADGNDITRSKPDPQVFLLAAERLGLPPAACLVVEDAEAGVAAAVAGGMKVLAVGSAANDPRSTLSAPSLADITLDQILMIRAS